MHPCKPRASLIALLLVAIVSVSSLAPAIAAPVLGFREDFVGPGVGLWAGGVPTIQNPGTGGRLGAGDGYLEFGNAFAGNFGIRCRSCPEYTGNWTAAGITQIRLWLKDVGAPQALEMHVAVGNDTSFWQYNPGFIPSQTDWTEFVVDLTNQANFTRTIGTYSFALALAGVSILQVRHDKAPFMQIPDPIQGDVGIDGILLTNGVVGIDPGARVAAQPLQLAPPFPNPSRGPVTFALQSFDDGPVTIEVVDVQGRTLRRVALPPAGAGPRTWLWDGRDDAGRLLPPGQYRARALSPSGGTSRAITRVH